MMSMKKIKSYSSYILPSYFYKIFFISIPKPNKQNMFTNKASKKNILTYICYVVYLFNIINIYICLKT